VRNLRLVLILLVFAATLMVAYPVAAQAKPAVSDAGVENHFPDGMIFKVSAGSDSPIQKIRLRYTILPDGTAASGEAKFEPSTSVSTSFTLAGKDPPRIYLPPGTTIQYYWQVTDAGGNTATTEQATFVNDDVRFDWKTLESNGVVVYYYSGSQDDAEAMLTVASEKIASMSKLLGASIGFPVKVWIYRSVSDMKPALQFRSETYEQSTITAGVRVATDTVLVLGNASFDTLRHELTHVVTAAAGEGPFASLPFWLDEGTAVYAESNPGAFGQALQRAIDRGSVFSIRSITSPQGDPDKVALSYGQSWSLVSYLVETYGGQEFAQLFAEIKGGKTIDQALKAVYGFDQDGLENEWRASQGLPPRETPSPPESEQPTGSPSGITAQKPDEGGGTSIGLIVGLVLGTLALAGAVGLAGLVLARRLR